MNVRQKKMLKMVLKSKLIMLVVIEYLSFYKFFNATMNDLFVPCITKLYFEKKTFFKLMNLILKLIIFNR